MLAKANLTPCRGAAALLSVPAPAPRRVPLCASKSQHLPVNPARQHRNGRAYEHGKEKFKNIIHLVLNLSVLNMHFSDLGVFLPNTPLHVRFAYLVLN